MAELEIGEGEKLKYDHPDASAGEVICPECDCWERFELGPIVNGRRTKIGIKCATCRGNGHIGGIYDTLPSYYESQEYRDRYAT